LGPFSKVASYQSTVILSLFLSLLYDHQLNFFTLTLRIQKISYLMVNLLSLNWFKHQVLWTYFGIIVLVSWQFSCWA